ncbi:MAG: tyrosine-type recombinase/integrase [Candidatus Aminicenantaceae bacterium]
MRFHDHRHTFATRLVKRGVDLITIQNLFGHHSVLVTQRYTHSNYDRKRNAVNLLGIFIPFWA